LGLRIVRIKGLKIVGARIVRVKNREGQETAGAKIVGAGARIMGAKNCSVGL
jgi:hypothetical protein